MVQIQTLVRYLLVQYECLILLHNHITNDLVKGRASLVSEREKDLLSQ